MDIPSRDEHERSLTDCLKRTLESRQPKLARQLGNPPSLSNVDPSLWDKIKFELEACTEEILLAMFVGSAMYHLLDNIIVRFTLEQARRRAEAAGGPWASARSRELATVIIDNSQEILRKQQERWQRQQQQKAAGLGPQGQPPTLPVQPFGEQPPLLPSTSPPERISREEIDKAVGKVLGKSRIKGIVTTETTRTIASAGEIAMRNAGLLHPNDIWIVHPELSASGPCPICLPLHRTTRAVWGVLFPYGPPVHPHCVCEVIYWNTNRAFDGDGPRSNDSVFIGTASGTVIAPENRGTRPGQFAGAFR